MIRRAADGRPAAPLNATRAALLRGFALAASAAERYVGATAPNPPVGCAALAADGGVLAVAAHARAGSPHAERLALEHCRRAGSLGRVAALVVTLEPCDHQGRTPPCTAAILDAGVPEVWIGAIDPNPRVSGAGVRRLAANGVATGLLASVRDPRAAELSAHCQRLIRPFATWVATRRPWVTVKQALDPHGSMIPPAGAKTFTSPASLELAHELRKRADALLTGAGTILADRPEFTVRHVPDHAGRRRLLLIADRRRRTPPDYLALAERRGFDARQVASIDAALDAAGAAGALRLLVEAGPTLTAAVLASGTWDEHVVIRSADGGAADAVSSRFRAAPG